MKDAQGYQVIVSERARLALGRHLQFMAQSSKSAARKTKTNLLEAMRSLTKMPQRYPFLDVDFIPRNKYHKMYVEKWYLVLYQIKDTVVYVDTIVDCRQSEYSWLLE